MCEEKIGATKEELAKQLRQFAELTASNSKNWDNFEQIALDMFSAIEKHYIERDS